ncbi:hypothetical protein B0H13DRAFT_2317984 [Mycena leptocephala]|nr:hypothetical protein B0H13DRAFT_2317984 [Mycena leptocephala]
MEDSEEQAAVSLFLDAVDEHQTLVPHTSYFHNHPTFLDELLSPTNHRNIASTQVDSTCLRYYYLNSISRIGLEVDTPTDLDIPSLQITCQITEITFTAPVLAIDRLVTPFGRLSRSGKERKWLHFFSDAESIILIVDLSTYNRTVYSEETDGPIAKLRDAMHRFKYTAAGIGISTRLYVERSEPNRVPFTECFPDYARRNEPEPAVKYSVQQFTHMARPGATRERYDGVTRIHWIWKRCVLGSPMFWSTLFGIGFAVM